MTEDQARIQILRQQRNGLMGELENASLVTGQLRARIAELEAELKTFRANTGPSEA